MCTVTTDSNVICKTAMLSVNFTFGCIKFTQFPPQKSKHLLRNSSTTEVLTDFNVVH